MLEPKLEEIVKKAPVEEFKTNWPATIVWWGFAAGYVTILPIASIKILADKTAQFQDTGHPLLSAISYGSMGAAIVVEPLALLCLRDGFQKIIYKVNDFLRERTVQTYKED